MPSKMDYSGVTGRLATRTTALLSTVRFGHRIVEYAVTDSTMDRADRLIPEGATEGCLVIADHQTSGRGRFRREWTDEPGQNLAFSVILYPRMAVGMYALIGVAAAVAVAETIERNCGVVRPEIKWPNDVLLGGAKAAGILLETHGLRSGEQTAVVLGIGLNVNQMRFPEELQGNATSLRLACGREFDRARLLADLLAALESRYDSIRSDDGLAVRNRFSAYLLGHDEIIKIRREPSGKTLTGLLLGIDENGSLRLRIDGVERTFHAGEISLTRAG